MGGKGALLLVLGFSIIFMVAGRNFNNLATGTTENFSKYYYDAKAHNIAAAGINIVANQLFLNNSLSNQTFNYNFDSGTASVTLATVGSQRQITSTGNFNGTTAIIKLSLQSSFFSRFAYFSDSEGSNIWWTTKDTVWGPFHTNGSLRVADIPVFYGRVTVEGSLIIHENGANPKFLGGFETGVHINIPTSGVSDVSAAATLNGAKFTGKDRVYLDFRGDSVRYKYSPTGSWTYKLASTFAPNGVIFAENAELRIKGVVKGKYTIAASGTSGNKGKIFLDDDIYYNTNPKTNPSSTDLLGIVAQRDVVITDNSANNNSITIQAAIYCQTGSFTAENYDSRGIDGNIDLYGGLTQYTRGPVGTFYTDWWGNTYIYSGFSKRYRYDERFMTSVPPSYPSTGMLEIVSWFE